MFDARSSVRPSPNEVRRAERYKMGILAAMRQTGSPKFNVTVRDLSVTGFACDTTHSLSVGARVWVTMAGLAALEAEVKWRNGYYYGFAFVRPLYSAVLDHITKRMTA